MIRWSENDDRMQPMSVQGTLMNLIINRMCKSANLAKLIPSTVQTEGSQCTVLNSDESTLRHSDGLCTRRRRVALFFMLAAATSILGIAEQFFKPSVYEPFWKSRGLKVKRECNGSLTYY